MQTTDMLVSVPNLRLGLYPHKVPQTKCSSEALIDISSASLSTWKPEHGDIARIIAFSACIKCNK